MRLTCPNCAAQYEVEDDVIPAAGRDVQCSNCGHTWYQKPNSRPVSRPAQAAQSDAPEAEPTMAKEQYQPEAVESAPAEDQPAFNRPAATMSEDVSGILREEAERELTQRNAEREAEGLEMQPELGGMDSNIAETPANIAESEGVLDDTDHAGAEAAAAAIAARGGRKDMLPDIEEINSTLSPEDQEAEDPQVDAKSSRRSGFRRGFLFIIVVFVIMVALYVMAPTIVEMNPQTTNAMAAYVDWVNGVRAGLDGTMASIAERVGAIVNSISASE